MSDLGGRTAALAARRAAVVPRGVSHVTAVAAAHGLGAVLVDPDGRPFVDLATGIGVSVLGHSHPEVVEAIRAQAGRVQHSCVHVATHEPYVALCERLVALLPHGDAGTKAMLVNTGAEAVENAVKIARQATGRPGVLCFGGAFHGRTLLGMSLTSRVGYKVGCGPFAPEIHRLPFPDRFRHGDGLGEAAFVARELRRLDDAFASVVAPSDLAAVLVEPVLGEGGFVPAPAAWLAGVRERCDRHGVLLILDEVQTGFGRTGAWGAYQRLGVVPDLSTWAKALGGGLPLGAVLGRADVMDAARPGTLGGTYGGNAIACAAALATLQVIERDGLCDRAEALGARIRGRLDPLVQPGSAVADVRGLGAMVGVELCERGDPHRPAPALAAEVLAACHARGVLLLSCGVYGNVVRVLCPLNVPEDVLDGALDALVDALNRRTSAGDPARE